LKIASFGALKRLDERGGEIDQFIESYGKDELGVQLEKLNFNNSKVSESTRNFILD
jgi:hypothetical protein